MKNEKSFTLIELLVVIAIIGLLSSIVLVNMDLPKQRQKARIAKTLEFSQSIQSALGSEAVGIWSFDDCGSDGSVPAILKDASGYGNNGTNNGAICREDTPQKVIGQGAGKYALSFNGVGDYVNVGAGNGLNLTNITVSAWVKTSISTTQFIVSRFGPDWDDANGYSIRVSSGKAIFQVMRNQTSESYSVAVGTSNISDGNWHYWVGTMEDQVVTKIYIDGVLEASSITFTEPGTRNPSTPNMFTMGRQTWSISERFNGFLDEVRVYSQALSISQIQKHYAEGLEKYGIQF